ncbi:hypothetical protein KAJ38_02150 [Candidatus Pacearchaeota archaeon]|nr:hypothetical protein [Candidatus Pacearchaeota archaeon]
MGKSLGDAVSEWEMGIEELDVAGRKEFEGLFMNHLYDRAWCWVNGIDYVSPDVARVKEKTYYEIGYCLVKGKGN